MPTISQLPTTQTVAASDAVPISQGGATHAVSLGTLLASTQPAIMISSGMLLGRTSLGAGGPEPVAIGSGLVMSQSTLEASLTNLAALPAATTLPPNGSVVVTASDSTPQLLELVELRGLFSAGNNVSITTAGVISSAGSGTTADYSIGALPTASAAAAQDLVGISQSGTDHAISYANLIDGQTIDMAQPAAAVSDGDSFWVAQGSNTMLAQTFSAVWPWIEGKLVTYKILVVEISANTTLDGTVHNNRVLVCSQAVTLTPLAVNMGNGFQCDIVNLSSGAVTLAGSIISSSGSSVLMPGQAATLRCLTYSGGTVFYAFMGDGGSAPSVPGQVSSLASAAQTANSVTLTWVAPVTGAIATGYNVQYRPTGSSAWTMLSQVFTSLTATVGGLTATTSYDFCVVASNAAGSGVASGIVTVSTVSAGSAPGMVTGLATNNLTSSSVQLSWTAPSSGGAPTGYTVQYRITGGSTWTGTVSGVSGLTQNITSLAASTSYDFSVVAVDATGSGPVSAVVTVSTSAAGAVTSIVWNVAPYGSYTHGSGVIGVNVHVTPSTAGVQFGFSTSATVAPSSWTAGSFVNTNLWGAYVPTPATAGTWYAWAAGTDGSAPTPYTTAFTVT